MIYKKHFIYFLLFNLFLPKIFSQSFLYPVAYDNKNNLIYIIHQKSIYDLSLWTWNPEKNFLQKALLSNFLPGGLKIVPSSSAFSFIHQGRLRVKYLQKRSPRSIDFFEPVCDISIVEWLNEEICYFAARKNKYFIICECNIKKSKIKTIVEKEADCIYPQIVSNNLFYIERTLKDEFRTSKSHYKVIKRNLLDNSEKVILDKDSNSIAFLIMKSEKEGFYLEHPSLIDREERLINFGYNRLYINENNWINEELFTFHLPVSYIFGSNNERLYESILPFLPKYNNNKIFFSSSKINKKNEYSGINIYCFDLISKTIEQKTEVPNNQISFSPLIIKNKCYYGSLSDENLFEADIDLSVNNLLPSFNNK